MAKYLSDNSEIDILFYALSDPTRRNILERLTNDTLTVSEIAHNYNFSLPTISNHISVLEKARLVSKKKKGREHTVRFEPRTMKKVSEYISFYTKFWNAQFDNLEEFLKGGEKNAK